MRPHCSHVDVTAPRSAVTEAGSVMRQPPQTPRITWAMGVPSVEAFFRS